MSDAPELRVRLTGCLPDTASSASIRPNGSLVIEIYDWSAEAEQWLGREAAYFMIVAAEHKGRILAHLVPEDETVSTTTGIDHRLLTVLQQRFIDYYAVKQWLEATGIPFEKDFDGWA